MKIGQLSEPNNQDHYSIKDFNANDVDMRHAAS